MQDVNFKQARLDKLKKIKELGWNAYKATYPKTHAVDQALNSLGKTVKTAGRIFS